MSAKAYGMEKVFDAQMLSGVYKIIILHHMKGSGTYPYKLYKHLNEHLRPGMQKVSKSDLYNLVASLEKGGFIRSRTIHTGAVVHKHYTLTKKGASIVKNSRGILMDALGKVQQLIKDELNG